MHFAFAFCNLYIFVNSFKKLCYIFIKNDYIGKRIYSSR